MIQAILWSISLVLMAIVSYLLSYLRFKNVIAQQTRQMIALMKAEDIEKIQIGDIFAKTDADFSDLERAALTLRKKYLRLKKQSQEERKGYENVFSGLKEGIVTVDQNLRVISFNQSFMNFFSWAPTKEHGSYFLHDIMRDPQIVETFKTTFVSNEMQKNEVESFQLFVTPLPSRNENESWCLGVFYDLSEIRKTEKIRIDFVANASHEMRTPLTVVKGYAELLKQKFEDKKLSEEMELLKPILQSTDQMSDLMSELLNLSKVEVNSVLPKNQLNTRDIMADVMVELENVLNMNNKKMSIEYGAEKVLANYDALKQILRNLLINAVKYSGNSSDIKIFWEKNENHTVLKVRDNGPGISKDHQDRIFERFYRVDKGRNRDQGGFGLGLALVKHHMLNHGGHVKINSELNNGSEFICSFPSV